MMGREGTPSPVLAPLARSVGRPLPEGPEGEASRVPPHPLGEGWGEGAAPVHNRDHRRV